MMRKTAHIKKALGDGLIEDLARYLFVHFRMKANIKNLPQAQGRSPEVAGRSGDFLQHDLLIGNRRSKFNDLFTGRHIDLFGSGNDLPCSFSGIGFLFCIHFFDN